LNFGVFDAIKRGSSSKEEGKKPENGVEISLVWKEKSQKGCQDPYLKRGILDSY